MNETQYTNKFMQAWKAAEPTLWWHKVADPTGGMGWASKPRAVDIVACLNGKFIGMEWKFRRNDNRFPINAVRYTQVLTLLGIYNAGGCALVAIGRYKKRNDKLVHLIPIKEWVRRCDLLKGPNDAIRLMKSINLRETFSEYEFRPWDFKWLGYNIRRGTPIDMRVPMPETMRRLYGTSKKS